MVTKYGTYIRGELINGTFRRIIFSEHDILPIFLTNFKFLTGINDCLGKTMRIGGITPSMIDEIIVSEKFAVHLTQFYAPNDFVFMINNHPVSYAIALSRHLSTFPSLMLRSVIRYVSKLDNINTITLFRTNLRTFVGSCGTHIVPLGFDGVREFDLALNGDRYSDANWRNDMYYERNPAPPAPRPRELSRSDAGRDFNAPYDMTNNMSNNMYDRVKNDTRRVRDNAERHDRGSTRHHVKDSPKQHVKDNTKQRVSTERRIKDRTERFSKTPPVTTSSAPRSRVLSGRGTENIPGKPSSFGFAPISETDFMTGFETDFGADFEKGSEKGPKTGSETNTETNPEVNPEHELKPESWLGDSPEAMFRSETSLAHETELDNWCNLNQYKDSVFSPAIPPEYAEIFRDASFVDSLQIATLCYQLDRVKTALDGMMSQYQARKRRCCDYADQEMHRYFSTDLKGEEKAEVKTEKRSVVEDEQDKGWVIERRSIEKINKDLNKDLNENAMEDIVEDINEEAREKPNKLPRTSALLDDVQVVG